ncbi:NDR1/HIN1-like protein 1 [Curcuma longa]|uniref:NDR1/HIN1-like protein 1 n=1 Tax=Curcuma longa TaxID=136217 RepID=UPI003D9F66CB
MSIDDCGNHDRCKVRRLYLYLAAGALIVVFLILLTILIIWLLLFRPTRPEFYLQDASVQQFNLTAGDSNALTFVLNVGLSSRNPNDRVGIYYDKLDAFAAYRGQQITGCTALPFGYQGHHDASVWWPFLVGEGVPLAEYTAVAMERDAAAGLLLLDVKIDGRLRWKAGPWTYGHRHLHVDCPASISVDHGTGTSGSSAPSFHFRQTTSCTVDV